MTIRFLTKAALFVLLTATPMAFAGAAPQTPISNTPLQTQTSGTNSGENVTLINPLGGVDCSSGNGDCLMAFLNNILKFVIRIGTIVVILMLVFVGFKFVTAQGNESQLTDARSALLWTVIGALVLLGAQAISVGIQATVQALSTGN